jgi:hypothetical protein
MHTHARASSIAARLLLVCAVLAALPCPAAPLRVAAWNLETPSDPAAADARISEVATLISAEKPDIVVLEPVADWQTCSRLTQALRPAAYNVIVCSAFRDPQTGATTSRQLAILSRHRAYFSWSEAWPADAGSPSPGGYAFAAIRAAGQRLGVFAVQLDPSLASQPGGSAPAGARSAAIQQWTESVESFKDWVTNRIQAAVVVGGFSSPLGSGGMASAADQRFVQVLLGAPLEQPIVVNPAPDAAANPVSARVAGDADNLPGVVMDSFPAVCELDATAPKPSTQAAAAQTPAPAQFSAATQPETAPAAAPSSTTTPAPAAEVAQAAPAPDHVQLLAVGLAVALAGVAALVAVVLWLGRRQPVAAPGDALFITLNTAGQDGTSPSGAVVMTPRSVTGSAQDSAASASQPIVHIESPDSTHTEAAEWKRRAIAAEQRADRANAVIKAGLLPQLSQWLRNKLVNRLVSDRAELLEAQQVVTLKALAVDERLSRLEIQIQRHTLAYQDRIDELTRELAAAREENRELIRTKIAHVKAEMEAARARIVEQERREHR